MCSSAPRLERARVFHAGQSSAVVPAYDFSSMILEPNRTLIFRFSAARRSFFDVNRSSQLQTIWV